MPMTTVERSLRASRQRTANARARRFRRYATEMAQAPIPDDVLDMLAEEFRAAGWTVTPPGEPVF
jgi:hypothetical protein